jgi:probable HAF family extracellular repeat protein
VGAIGEFRHVTGDCRRMAGTMKNKRLLLLVAAIFVLSTGWTIRVLPTLPGGGLCSANAINERGEVAGQAQSAAGVMRAVIWNASGAIYEIPTPVIAGGISIAEDLNESGYVVGRMATTLTPATAFVFRAGVVTNLTASSESRAFSISNANHVAGQWTVAGTPPRHHAVVWGSATPGSPYFLGSLGGYIDLAADIAKNAPIVAGTVANQLRNRHAFLWTDTAGLRDLGTLGGTNSYGRAVMIGTYPDPAGDTIYVTGESETAGGGFNTTPFLWHRGTMTSIGLLSGCTSGNGYSINKNKDIVGTCTGGGIDRAFLWRSGALIDLNTVIAPGSGWDRLYAAYDINDSGQIAGFGSYLGQIRGFVLTP